MRCAEIDLYQLDLTFVQDKKKQLSAKYIRNVHIFPRGHVAVNIDKEPVLAQDFYWRKIDSSSY